MNIASHFVVDFREISGSSKPRFFAKPMFCNPVLFMKTTGITKTTKTAQTATSKGVDCRMGGNHGKATEMTKTTGIQGAKHRFPKT